MKKSTGSIPLLLAAGLSLMSPAMVHAAASQSDARKAEAGQSDSSKMLPKSSLKDKVETFYIGCPGTPATTPEVNECVDYQLKQAQAVQQKYLAAIRQRLKQNFEDEKQYRHETENQTLEDFEQENKAWDALIDKAATATYQYWADGTIRGYKELHRSLKLTELRTHEQWQNWLTYADSTPAILPEPRFKEIHND